MRCIPMPSLSDYSYKEFSAKINDKNYSITVRWNEFNECAFCQIKYNGEELLDDEYPLVCNGVIDIDHRKLPRLMFWRQDFEDLPPIKKTFNQYGLFYVT